MAKFRSCSDLPVAISSAVGAAVYTYSYVLNGEEISEEWQIDAEIQSFLPGCSVESLISRYRSSGDASILKVRDGFYTDVSNMPKDLVEAYAALDALKENLSVVKEQPTAVKEAASAAVKEAASAAAEEVVDANK